VTDRTEGGLFRQGHAVRGGRTPGPSRAEKIATFLEPHVEDTLTKLAELAKMGDGKSAELLLKYVAPPARPPDEMVIVPGFASAPTLEGKSAAVMAAIANGDISANAGQRLLQALETHVRVVTAGDVEERLAALERGKPKTITVDNATGAVIDNSDLA
jgi:hypothetical protein